jgi:DNA-binding SARP family transcriptional activator/DNA-binding beta-propeller fold protein YncE
VEFRILGPFEGVEEGRLLPLGAKKQRALLVLLLLHRGEVVSTDRLVDGLWGEHAPPTAVKSLQVYVSQLRKVVGDGVLETRGRGYVLSVEPDQLDADRFESMLEHGRALFTAGDAGGAAAVLREGLALWRGPPLADFAYEPFAQPEIARLEELRLATQGARIEADLAVGRHEEILPELETLTLQHPLREGFRIQLMLAQYRAGRQAEALDGYKQVRTALDAELGLEPSRELQDLEQAILRQDPALDAPPGSRPLIATARRRSGRVLALGGLLLLGAAALTAAIALTRDNGSAAILSAIPNSVAAIDPETNTIVAVIPVGASPTSIAVGGGRVWVLNRDAQTISLIDAKSRTLVKTFAVGATPAGLAYGAGRIWVGDSGAPAAIELDTKSGAVVRTVLAPPLTPPPRRSGPLGGAIATGLGAVWLSSGNATITRIDPKTGGTVRIRHRGLTSDDISQLAVGEGAVWVSSCCSVVTRIHPATNTVAAVLEGFGGPIAAGLGGVWLAAAEEGLLWRIEPSDRRRANFPTRTIGVGPNPLGVAVGEGSVWVANGDGTVTRVDPSSYETTTIEIGRSLAGIAAGDGAVWVTVG